MGQNSETEYKQELKPLGKVVRFLAWFSFILALIFLFTGLTLLSNIFFVVWIISGILSWAYKLKKYK